MIPLSAQMRYDEEWPDNSIDFRVFEGPTSTAAVKPTTARAPSQEGSRPKRPTLPPAALGASRAHSSSFCSAGPIFLVVTAAARCTLTARFFCSRLVHYLQWCGETVKLFVASANFRDHRLTRREDDEALWTAHASRCISEATGFIDSFTDPVLGLSHPIPVCVIYVDCASSASCSALHELMPISKEYLLRHIFFAEGWADVRCDCSFISVNLPTRSLRTTRCRGSVACSRVAGYLNNVLPCLHQIYVCEPEEGDPLGGLKTFTPIYFIRHGQSEYNLEDRLGGDPDLTAAGFVDAQDLADFFEHQVVANPTLFPGRTEKWDSEVGFQVWCSQLRRTQHTAEPCAEVLCSGAMKTFKSLNEIHAGICEDMTNDEVKLLYPYIQAFRHHDKIGFRYPNGESYRDIVTRLTPLLVDLHNAQHCVLVVAHQAVLRTTLSFFGGPSVAEAVSAPCPQRTIWICTYNRAGEPRLAQLSLPPRRATQNESQDTILWTGA